VPIMLNNRDEGVAPTRVVCWLIDNILPSIVPAFPPHRGSAECNPQGTPRRIAAYQNGQRIRCKGASEFRKCLGLGKSRRSGILARTRRS
jgi:hypothetical protein